MNHDEPQGVHTAGGDMVPRKPPWRMATGRFLVLAFLLSLTTVWLSLIQGCNEQKTVPEPLTGWRLIDLGTEGPFVSAYVAMAVCVVVALGISESSRRTIPLAAAGRSVARLFALCVLPEAVMAIPIGLATLHEADFALNAGFYWGMTAVALAIVLELTWLCRITPLLIRQRSGLSPWRLVSLRTAGLLTVNLIALAMMIVADAVALIESVDIGVTDSDWVTTFRVIAVVLVQATGVLSIVALAVATWGLLARQRWAAWLHLSVAAYLIGLVLFLSEPTNPVPPWARWLIPPLDGADGAILLVAVTCWGLGGWVLGLWRSGATLQRGVCGDCGKKFWRTVARCPVCGDRYCAAGDRATADLCLTCGHERSGRLILCRQCSQKATKRRRRSES
ncbi:MAG: hypothetical protein JXL80_12560 [Planctomycetes bacterium]|nr:hypothetical protein [Planctomycetota bacterium]